MIAAVALLCALGALIVGVIWMAIAGSMPSEFSNDGRHGRWWVPDDDFPGRE